jgi:hypothetical protein
VGFLISGGSRVVVGRLQQRSWTAEDGSARSVEEPGPVASSTLGWTATLCLATLDRWGLDPELVREANAAREFLLASQHAAERARTDYHHAIRRLHPAGGSLREIAEALRLSHQRGPPDHRRDRRAPPAVVASANPTATGAGGAVLVLWPLGRGVRAANRRAGGVHL